MISSRATTQNATMDLAAMEVSPSDLILRRNLAAYQRLQDDRLTALPGVVRMTSTLVMKRIVHDRPLPA
jgi:hypothetical protein